MLCDCFSCSYLSSLIFLNVPVCTWEWLGCPGALRVPKLIPSWCVLCELVLLCSYWGRVVQGRLCSGGLLLPLGLPLAFPSWGRAPWSPF